MTSNFGFGTRTLWYGTGRRPKFDTVTPFVLDNKFLTECKRVDGSTDSQVTVILESLRPNQSNGFYYT